MTASTISFINASPRRRLRSFNLLFHLPHLSRRYWHLSVAIGTREVLPSIVTADQQRIIRPMNDVEIASGANTGSFLT
jgi:hypothetical protein